MRVMDMIKDQDDLLMVIVSIPVMPDQDVNTSQVQDCITWACGVMTYGVI